MTVPPLTAAALLALLLALAFTFRARSARTVLVATAAVAALSRAADGAPPGLDGAVALAALLVTTWLALRLVARAAPPVAPSLLGGAAEIVFAISAAVTALAATGSFPLGPGVRQDDAVLQLVDASSLAVAAATAVGAAALLAVRSDSIRLASGGAMAIVAAEAAARSVLATRDPLLAAAAAMGVGAALLAGAWTGVAPGAERAADRRPATNT